LFDELVENETLGHTLAPEGVFARNSSPYFTYEVGIDEAPHPDRDVVARFVEIATSHCKYGCKIYADPYSEIRALVHSSVFGCKRTVADINDREEGDIHVGDTVAFASLHDPLVKYTGRVLNYIPPDDAGFRGGYHVGCYYIISKEQIFEHSSGETYQQAYDRLIRDGLVNEEQLASYFGITVEKLRSMRLKTEENLIFDGTEFESGDMVSFYDFEDLSIKHLGEVRRYIPPHHDPDTYPHGGYIIVYKDERKSRHILIYQKNKLRKEY
jgi:hypothetical protein